MLKIYSHKSIHLRITTVYYFTISIFTKFRNQERERERERCNNWNKCSWLSNINKIFICKLEPDTRPLIPNHMFFITVIKWKAIWSIMQTNDPPMHASEQIQKFACLCKRERDRQTNKESIMARICWLIPSTYPFPWYDQPHPSTEYY